MTVIDSPWIVSMICCGVIGFIFHIIFVTQTSRHFYSEKLNSKNRIFVFGCILFLCLNMLACLIWGIFRSNIIIPLSVTVCKVIYTSNFLCYFMAKYVLHCLLIFRIYITFRGDKLEYMSRKILFIFISIVSFIFLVALSVWFYSVLRSVNEGVYTVRNTDLEICTLFSDTVNYYSLSITLSAVTIGIQDFIVGSVTFFVFLKRFRQIAVESHEIHLLESSTRLGVVAFFSIISTLLLFTFAVPFYPYFTFILSVDATINSLCLFCALPAGKYLYYYVCICFKTLDPDAKSSGYLMRSSAHLNKPNNKVVITTSNGNAAIINMDKPLTPLTSSSPSFNVESNNQISDKANNETKSTSSN